MEQRLVSGSHGATTTTTTTAAPQVTRESRNMKGLLLVALFGLATASLLPPIANLKLVENFEGEAVETSTLDATESTSEDTSSTDTEETTFETTGSTDFDNSTQYTSSTDNSNSTDTLPTTTDITTTTEGSGGDELSDGCNSWHRDWLPCWRGAYHCIADNTQQKPQPITGQGRRGKGSYWSEFKIVSALTHNGVLPPSAFPVTLAVGTLALGMLGIMGEARIDVVLPIQDIVPLSDSGERVSDAFVWVQTYSETCLNERKERLFNFFSPVDQFVLSLRFGGVVDASGFEKVFGKCLE
ncbi:hypothetical protein O3P69_019167 [Scylla paramamosain]|uniref:Uncharacterized protein n=1 Tax=Scylla paramamosain TaxID=85552 RepID=A0AAW0SWD0_SCYPA